MAGDFILARGSRILDFLVGKDGVKQVTVHPVWIAAEQPYLMTDQEAEPLREKMQAISEWQ